MKLKQIFINLPVEDLEKSLSFYLQLGFTINPLFTFSDQKCMSWSDEILVMLQSKEFFGNHTDKKISDTKNYLATTFTLPVESFDEVNQFAENALTAGGTEPSPMVDEDFLQVRTILDPDGHSWGIMYLDMVKFREQKSTKDVR